ncbi:LacI family DNA-binding transcriptional regulator [Hymenobacter sp. BT683]|uniref:LacI family DNA-binding transcriptional regulator n=1 Tax=Hymenobacter jeongseonensis TaxID=2791027 RepID=A0ABS0IGB7_9BACT|nr:LacI family DNA-binding transcriptional regulator [Hymenobacter jeongseonensis]MBF9237403.1 LacI family DNA-binding transcriptional regulator [Hymenobacter jeongseonensis]
MSAKKHQTSIKDLALQLNLSISTVSRALAGHRDISEATKQRVRQLAQELSFRPNQLAAALRKGHSKTLGVIVPHIKGYFFPAVLNGIEKVATREGFNVMMCQSNEDLRREKRNIETLLDAQVEGILMSVSATTHPEVEHFEQVRRQGIPLVFFDRVPELPQSMAVVLDDFQGAYQAVSHLIAQGCTRIAHLAGPQHLNTSRNRCLGYLEALRAHGIAHDEQWLYSLPTLTHEAGRLGMQHLLDSDPKLDGLFAAYAIPTVGALEVLREQGRRVPQDMALACFSNEPFTAMTQPQLTVIDQRAEQMGETAVRLFLQLLKRGPVYAPPHLVLKPELIIRNSSLHRSQESPVPVR